MESDSEEEEEEEEVVVEVEQRPSSLSVQDRITGRQLEHLQVSHSRLAPKLELSGPFVSFAVKTKSKSLVYLKVV